ncbi:MAG: hypothetical protein LBQ22_01905 [Bacteroidales bacterium]|jgi:hypothetical protein|nr:hypothetical protein [Bacteroidales bacterium]
METKTNKEFFIEKYGEAQISAWKQQYGNIFCYKTTDGKSCVLRPADLITLDACRVTAGRSSIKFDMALVENCWLGGDKELLSIDKYRMGLFDWLGGIIQKIEGELEEF